MFLQFEDSLEVTSESDTTRQYKKCTFNLEFRKLKKKLKLKRKRRNSDRFLKDSDGITTELQFSVLVVKPYVFLADFGQNIDRIITEFREFYLNLFRIQDNNCRFFS